MKAKIPIKNMGILENYKCFNFFIPYLAYPSLLKKG